MPLLLLCLTSANGAVLRGQVTDPNGNGLPAVSVVTNVTEVGRQADINGRFELKLTDEVTRVTFSTVGFTSRQFAIDNVPAVVVLQPRYYEGTGILVTAERARAGVSPVAFENVSRDDIARDYTVGELPLLLESTPNLYSFADGGGALGYSYVKIRGFDDKRIATYINGVPLNDPEDQATYFVDLPDFAANAYDIQVQRGVGNSLYGDASFGGSINVTTSAFAKERSTKVTAGYGEYTSGGKSIGGIYKQSVEYSSGLVDGRWHFAGRFSKQKTDGYREHSWYRGWAYYFSLGRIDPHSTTELYVYGGPMKMHLAYYGAGRDAINVNRRSTPLTYGDETDNFNQPHYHLHNTYEINDRATLSNTLYYIRGRGYYEQYKNSRLFSDYGIDASLIDLDSTGNPYSSGDLVRQQWVEKNQFGWNPRLDIDHDRGSHTAGGSFYYFTSDHYGRVTWAQHISGALDPMHKYYQYDGTKWLGSMYVQEYYKFTDRLSTQATAQLRFQRYSFDQTRMGAFVGYNYDLNWLFFSPRIGLNYQASDRLALFANVAISSRTPTDASIYDANDPYLRPSLVVISVNADSTEWEFGDPTADNERVYDLELGGRYRTPVWGVELNLFWMEFENEIIPWGGVNENGILYTANADRSVHAGVELSSTVRAHDLVTVSGNFSYNYNRVREYVAAIDGVLIDFKDQKTTGFPDYIGNVITDFRSGDLRITNRVRFVGRQYLELLNLDEFSIDPYIVSSLSIEYGINNFLQLGRLVLQGRVDNIADKRYEASGYGGNWAYVDSGTAYAGGWAEYFVASERSFYGQISLELF